MDVFNLSYFIGSLKSIYLPSSPLPFLPSLFLTLSVSKQEDDQLGAKSMDFRVRLPTLFKS